MNDWNHVVFTELEITTNMSLEIKNSSGSPCDMYVDLFSCASLRIGEEDWNSLVNSGKYFT